MSDAELFEWFNKRAEAEASKPRLNQTVIDSLLQLRDALIRETQRPAPKRKSPPRKPLASGSMKRKKPAVGETV